MHNFEVSMELDTVDPSWLELLGSKQWEGLLDPLNLDLRKLILRCGDFIQATYDAFNSDQHSKYCGSSRYGKRDFFHKVALESASNYEVSSFLYATSTANVPLAFLLHSLSPDAWSRESNWMGYIAVSSDTSSRASGRREIYVAWRGTIRDYEWMDVLDPVLVSIKQLLDTEKTQSIVRHGSGSSSSDEDDGDDTPKVMRGWYTIYTSDNPNSQFTKKSARDQLLTKIKELVNLYKDENLSITFVGHSLGAALAILSALDVVTQGLSTLENKPEFPVCAIVFGSPHVGNKAFNDKLKEHNNLRVLHVRNEIDLIPLYPSRVLGYVDSGVVLLIDTRKSPYLKDSKNPSDWHNLQGMLHVVAGWNGDKGEFGLQVKRSVALVNKSSDFLTYDCLLPGSWWVEKNKGMVLGHDGEWTLAPPDEEDLPVPEF